MSDVFEDIKVPVAAARKGAEVLRATANEIALCSEHLKRQNAGVPFSKPAQTALTEKIAELREFADQLHPDRGD